jgi:hypothetical protein
MIYATLPPDEAVSQGDIIDDCPIAFLEKPAVSGGIRLQPATVRVRVVILTQACDMAQAKAARILVAVVHDAQNLALRGILKGNVIRDQVRSHRIYGWYFLPARGQMVESVVDLRDLHTIERPLLEELARDGKRLIRLTTPCREHLAQHFATTYSRIALPEPYETQTD